MLPRFVRMRPRRSESPSTADPCQCQISTFNRWKVRQCIPIRAAGRFRRLSRPAPPSAGLVQSPRRPPIRQLGRGEDFSNLRRVARACVSERRPWRSNAVILSPGEQAPSNVPMENVRRVPCSSYLMIQLLVPFGRMRRNNPSPSPSGRSRACLSALALSQVTAACFLISDPWGFRRTAVDEPVPLALLESWKCQEFLGQLDA